MSPSDPTHLSVEPLPAPFGATLRGLDLGRPLGDAEVAAIREAQAEHLVLVFPDQRLSPESHIDFSRRFGELQVHVLSEYHFQGHPEIYHLTNVAPDGSVVDAHPDRGTLKWHTDTSFQAVPCALTLLYGREVPREGADTLFADMYAAFEALPEGLKQRVQSLEGVHDLAQSRRDVGHDDRFTEEKQAAAPPVLHPLARRHPRTGRLALYIGSHCARIEGLPPAESRALLDELTERATQPGNVYRHRWRRGDLVVWDNRCVLHCATPFDTARERRDMVRTLVKGEAVLGPPSLEHRA